MDWKQEDLKHFDSFDDDDWTKWLLDGITDWHHNAQTHDAFKPASDHFRQSGDDPIEYQLDEMYAAMEGPMKFDFQNGLEKALEEVSKDDPAVYKSLCTLSDLISVH